MNKIAFFIFIFLFCTILGLYVGERFIPEVGDTNPLTGQSVDDPSGALYFLGVIMFGTLGLLLVLKYYKGKFLFKLLEIYIIFIGSMMVWQFVLFDILDAVPFVVTQEHYIISIFIFSALTALVRFVHRSFAVNNMTLAIAIAGAGGALGAYMGFFPSLLLMLALGTYDVIAVFKTKHMITLAEDSRVRELPVMFEIPSKGIKTGPRKGYKKKIKGDLLGLGTGDVAIPLIFFVGILRTFQNWFLVGMAVFGAMVGLALIIYYVSNVKRVALPALPPIIGCSVISLGLGFLLI